MALRGCLMRRNTKTLFTGSAALAMVATLLQSVGGPAAATAEESPSYSSATFAGRDIKEFDIPTRDSGVTDLTLGPDGTPRP